MEFKLLPSDSTENAPFDSPGYSRSLSLITNPESVDNPKGFGNRAHLDDLALRFDHTPIAACVFISVCKLEPISQRGCTTVAGTEGARSNVGSSDPAFQLPPPQDLLSFHCYLRFYTGTTALTAIFIQTAQFQFQRLLQYIYGPIVLHTSVLLEGSLRMY